MDHLNSAVLQNEEQVPTNANINTAVLFVSSVHLNRLNINR